jgi:hypothetical protein
VPGFAEGVVGIMPKRFVCRFSVGKEGLAYSGVWRVWTARNQPDLYLAVEAISGQQKATVHCPRPSRPDWERHYGFPIEATGPVATAAKRDSGPHKVRWTGCQIGPDCTLEYRVIFSGKSLDKFGKAVRADTTLLPIPAEQEFVEVAVVLGPTRPTVGYPRETDSPTHLLSEGRLSDDRKVWVVYCTKPTNNKEPPQQHTLSGGKFYLDQTADFSKLSMRVAVFGPQDDGSLVFLDKNVKFTPKAG